MQFPPFPVLREFMPIRADDRDKQKTQATSRTMPEAGPSTYQFIEDAPPDGAGGVPIGVAVGGSGPSAGAAVPDTHVHTRRVRARRP